MFDTDDSAGFEFELEPDSEQELAELPALADKPEGEETVDEKPLAPPAPEYVPREKFDEVVNTLSEMRGRLAALTESGQRVTPPPAENAPDPNAGLAELKRRLKAISQKMYDPDTAEEGLEEFLNLSAHIGRVQAEQITQQYAGQAVTTAADLIIENFMSRMEKKDELFDQVSPLLEEELKKVDKSAVARMPRADVLDALNRMYKASRADVLDKMWQSSRDRAKRRTQAAPNLGGGGKSAAEVPDLRAQKINKAQRDMALAMGFKEEELGDLFKDEGNDEW